MTKANIAARRRLTFIAIFAGYFFLTLARRGFTVTSTVLLSDSSLGLTKADVGVVVSIFTVSTGCGKFVGGVLTDAVSSRRIFVLGLLVAALSNAAIGYFVGYTGAAAFAISAAWGVNGLAQGFAWPAIAQLIIRRFPPVSRGAIWGWITMAGNAAKVAAPLIFSRVALQWGWRAVFQGSAALALAGAAASWTFIPASAAAPAEGKAGGDGEGAATVPAKEPDAALDAKAPEVKVAFCADVARRPSLWALLLADLLIYLVLEALSSWLIPLTIARHAVSAKLGATLLSCYELGGVIGTLGAGYLSDALGGVGRRNLTSLWGCAALVIALARLRSLPVAMIGTETRTLELGGALFIAGMGVYGPKTMAGIAVREMHPSAVGAVGAILGLVGQLGASLAGYPLVVAVEFITSSGAVDEWDAVFGTLLVSALGGTALFAALHFTASKKTKKKIYMQ